jgi:WD40 repeat protein
MDSHPPRYDQLAPSALYELLRVHRQNMEILTLQAAKFTNLYQPPYLQYNLDETIVAIDGLIAELRRRGLNPDAPPVGVVLIRRQAVMAPRLPDGFVDRPTEREHLLATILDPGRTQPVAITTALQGAGGVGKTTLAAALCHTPAVINAFPDGILWVTLGETPRLMDALRKLCDALAPERPSFVDEEQGAIALTSLLHDRRCLIVLDDVWKPEHLRPFFRGTTTCTWLITTRNASVAAPARPVLVDTMTIGEAVQLLISRLPNVPADLTPFRRLAQRLGAWPLLLELAGSALWARVERGEPLAAALHAIHKLLDKRGVVAFDQRDAQERHQAVATTLALSLNLLSPEERTAYTDLAVFPEDVDVPLVALGRLWDLDELDTEEVALRLDSLSLLKLNLQTRTIRLHDVLRTFLIHQAGTALPALHNRLLNAYEQPFWAELPHDEPYLWRHLVYHLIGAERQAEVLQTVTDLRYVAIKTFLFGTSVIEHDFRVTHASQSDDVGLILLERTFMQIAHLLTRCTSLHEMETTLASRCHHLDVLEPLILPLLAKIKRPFVMPWHPLPDNPQSALLRTLESHTAGVLACAMSADGNTIISGSADATIKIWDTHTGTNSSTLRGHRLWVTACVISVDGTIIVSASRDQTLKIWDVAACAERMTLIGHTAWVTACALSTDGGTIVSASADGTLKLWDTKSGICRATLHGHTREVRSCAISADGTFIVSCSEDRTLKVWDSYTGIERATLVGHTAAVISCVISADNRVIISGSDDGSLKVWDVHTNTNYATLIGHTAAVTGCAITADNRVIVSSCIDGTVKIWIVETFTLQTTLTSHTDGVRSCAISADGTIIVSAADDHTLKVWDATIPTTYSSSHHHTGGVQSCAVSTNGQLIVSASRDHLLKLWDSHTGIAHTTLSGHTDAVLDCAISPDESVIVSASADYTLKVWDAHSGHEHFTLHGHAARVWSCLISPHGDGIVSTSADGTLTVWDMHTRTITMTLIGHKAPVWDCTMSSDGNTLISASADHTLKIWDVQSGRERATLRGHEGGVNGCVISTDGRLIISASADHTLRLWDAYTGHECGTLQEHTAPVWDCALSPDGRLLISVAADHTLRLWDLSLQQCLITFYADSPLYSCNWHPDNIHLIATGLKGMYFLQVTR